MIVKDEGTFIKILTFIDSSKAAHSLFNDFEFDLEAILTPLERKKQKKNIEVINMFGTQQKEVALPNKKKYIHIIPLIYYLVGIFKHSTSQKANKT